MRILQNSTLWHFYKPDSPAARLEGSPLFSQSRTFAKWVFSRAPLSFGSSLEFSSVLTPLSCLFLVLPCYLSGCGGLASNLPFSLLWRCNTYLIGRVFGRCDLIFTTGNDENIANKCINKLAVKTWAARVEPRSSKTITDRVVASNRLSATAWGVLFDRISSSEDTSLSLRRQYTPSYCR